MGKYKTNTIQLDLGIFTHIPASSNIYRHIQPDIVRHIQAYSENCLTLIHSEPGQIEKQKHIQNLDIFRTMACSKPWHIQNQRHIHDPDIFKIEIYLEP